MKNKLPVIFMIALSLIIIPYSANTFQQKEYRSTNEKQSLFSILKCIYLRGLDIQYKDIYKLKAIETKYYQQFKKKVDANSKKYAHHLEKKTMAPTYVKWISPQVGYGLFASENIKKGDFVGEFFGTVREYDPFLDSSYSWAYPYIGLSGTRLVVDSKFKGNELRFVNHSSKPNCKVIYILGHDGMFHICYVAIKDVQKNQQLTISYGKKYWQARKINPQEL